METLGEEGRGASRASARAVRADGTPPTSSRLTLKAKRNRRVKGGRAIDARAIANACGRALRRSLSTIVALLVVAAIGGTAWAGYRFVTTSPRFAIDTIDIRGTARLDAARLRADLPVRIGDNVFTASLGGIVERLRANPWIESVDARRVLPHAIVVELHERAPVAVVELDDTRYLVDASAHPFKRADANDGAGLPLVTGLQRASYVAAPDATGRDVQRALAALASWRARAERPLVDEVRVLPRGTLAFVVAAGPTIELGRDAGDLAARFAAFDATWASLSADDRARATEIRMNAERVTVGFAHH